MSKQNLKGIVYCLLTAIFWGSGFPVQFIGGLSIGSCYFNAFRSLIGAFVLFLAIIINNLYKNKKIIFFTEQDNIKYTVKISMASGLILVSAILVQQFGVEKTISAKSGLISSLTCIVVPFILMIFTNRKINYKTWFLLIILVFGMFLLNSVESAKFNYGDFLCFISTILFSIDIIMINFLVKKIDPLKFSLFRFITVFIISSIMAQIFKEKLTIIDFNKTLPMILYSGVFVTGLAYTTQIIGEKYTEPVIATILMGLEGLFACIFGFLILNEILTKTQIIGCIIIIISTILIQINENKYNVENSI